ncbi:hypothetical protein [Heyndrickxia camelliae]|uniref:Conjugal transfer protein n=1 Tax=Heyndrickxia camelliae TaxID=1707093 RepID=A0A2N3LEI0_9BACI|nr:hypothetical protein [Heyndrickxia camelliae]PKR83050.1 hypothetical protein CWO92_21170 [Heyndrickxia camelliae]
MHEEIKNALAEIIGDRSIKGREWFFPKNVDNRYKIFANMTLKEILKFILPAAVLSVIVAIIPPYSVPPYSNLIFWFIKLIVIAIIFSVPVFYVNYRPVKYRDNIRTQDFIKEYLEYKKMKKMYFIKPRKKPWESEIID